MEQSRDKDVETIDPAELVEPEGPEEPRETEDPKETDDTDEPELKLPDWIKPDPGAGDKGKLLYIEEWATKGRFKDLSDLLTGREVILRYKIEKYSTKRLYSSFGHSIMSRHGLNHMNFRVLLEQDEDGYYTITVPSLPGCISQGATEKEAKENIKEAIVLHLYDGDNYSCSGDGKT